MSPDKQNIAIAEACGVVSKDSWGPLYKTDRGYVRGYPEYVYDLNAMHEALKTQPIRVQQKYIPFLRNLCAVEGSWPEEATAAQRAEAFLRTVGKWEKDK
jgi:hypothetical protein